MFNPTEYTISKSNNWHATANKSKNVPKYEFPGGEPRSLDVSLFFDSYLEGPTSKRRDLWFEVNKLFNLMYIDKATKSYTGKITGMSIPPWCRFEWGKQTKHSFDCFVKSCSVTFKMFDSAGVPIRATAKLGLVEAVDSEDLLKTNPTSRGEPGRRRRIVLDGDRLELIAFQEYGDSREWRRIAEANRLTDPLALRPGMALAIPPR
jgi:hypothetical protein